MNIFRLATRNVAGNAFRSGAVFACAALVACLALCATLVVRGAQDELRGSLERLGADVIVIPWGTMRTEDMEGARLLSMATKHWMPRAYMRDLAAVKGVAAVSPQLYLATLTDTPYCAEAELYLVAYDATTDFVVRPWLVVADASPGLGEVIAGAGISVPDGGDRVTVYGSNLHLVSTLKPTGSDLDHALLVSFETAHEIVAASQRQAGHSLYVAPDSVSAVLVKIDTGANAHDVAIRILEQVPGALPIESTNLFQTERAHMVGLIRSMLFILGVIWALSMVFVGLISSLAANERRREIGVLRALGGTRSFVLHVLLTESVLLAVGGGLFGVACTILAVSLAWEPLVETSGLPFLLPSPGGFAALAVLALTLALVSVVVAALIPAFRISREEAAIVMRE